MKKLRGFQSKEFNTVGLKKLRATEMPMISKSTSYWRALKVCSLLFLLSEAAMLFALLFNQVTLTEFWQISLFLLVLWPMMPLILRMKNDKTFLIITGSVLIVMVALLTAMKLCDQYYVKSVFEAYLQGEDYQRKSDFLSKFASSNAIAYTQFLIAESDFLRQGVLEAKQIKEVISKPRYAGAGRSFDGRRAERLRHLS